MHSAQCGTAALGQRAFLALGAPHSKPRAQRAAEFARTNDLRASATPGREVAGSPLFSCGFFLGELLRLGTLRAKALPVNIDQLCFVLGGSQGSPRSSFGGGL